MAQKGQPGVRYMTEELVKKVAKQEHLEAITILNLTLNKEGNKKFKFIENLDRLKKLHTLNLSGNMIEKMEKLEKLARLRELNLSYNCITKIEGIECLLLLQVLNLTGNQIEHLPAFLGKKLKSLRTLKVAKNQLQSLEEFSKLRPLKDLTQLTIADNPVTRIPHCRPYLVFHLRTLDSIDGQNITRHERETSDKRFSQEAVEELEAQIQREEQRLKQLQEDHNRSLGEIKEQENKEREQKSKMKDLNKKLAALEQELDTKNNLLKRKTTELTVACQKHYELEQELAFYKIDHKFDKLGKPDTPVSDLENIPEEMEGESAYVGKGRFHKNSRQRSQRQGDHVEQTLKIREDSSSMQPSALNNNEKESALKKQDALDRELESKLKHIEQAENQLRNLQNQMKVTEQQLRRAEQEKEMIATDVLQAQQRKKLAEEDAIHIKSKLAKKINLRHTLRDEAGNIHSEMKSRDKEIHAQEHDIGRLKAQLRRVDVTDPLHRELKQQLSDREEQLEFEKEQYGELERQLEDMILHITVETEQIKELEGDLPDGTNTASDEVRAELEGVINGLQSYLDDIHHNAKVERSEYEKLAQEREELLQALLERDEDKVELANQRQRNQELEQKIYDIETTLDDERNLNQSLQNELDVVRAHELEQQNKTEELGHHEEEKAMLRDKLVVAEENAHAAKMAYERKLDAEKKRVHKYKDKASDLTNKEEEIRNLHSQLAALQGANARLQDQLFANQQKLLEQHKKNLNPDDVRERLQDMMRYLRTGKGGIKHPGRNDKVGQALAEVQTDLEKELEKSFREAQTATDLQAQLEYERDEADKLKEEIERLHEELEHLRNVQDKSRPKPASDHYTYPSATSQASVVTASVTGSSTVPSSQWSQRRQDMYNSMTEDEQALFDELQREIADLRDLLAMNDPKVASKMADVGTLAQDLRDMVEKRSRSVGGNGPRSVGGNAPSDIYNSGKWDDPRLKQAAEDLARAEEEIDELQSQLNRHPIKDEERAQKTIFAQQEELDQMHDILEEQKNEIQRLNGLLQHITGGLSGSLPYDDNVAELRQRALNVRNTLAEQEPQIYQKGSHYSAHPNTFSQPQAQAGVNQGGSVVPGRPVPVFYQSQPGTIQAAPAVASNQPAQVQEPAIYGTQLQPGAIMTPGSGQAFIEPSVQTRPDFNMFNKDPRQHLNVDNHSIPMVQPGIPTPSEGPHHPRVAQTVNNDREGMSGRGQFPYDGNQNIVMMEHPVTPERQRGHGDHSIMMAQTTPIAGSMMSMSHTPIGRGTQPVMMSTPATPGDAAPRKSILKRPAGPEDMEDEMICNVPEHHNLEDYVARLKEELKAFKHHLKQKDNKKVVFGENVEDDPIKLLQEQLKERRRELEGLDLAVEKQKSHLKKMQEIELVLLEKRDVARNELEELRNGKPKREKKGNRARDNLQINDSDYHYEFDPRYWGTREEYLQNEIKCLEETLAKRRAELREADKLLQECHSDLTEAKIEARDTIQSYDIAQEKLTTTEKETREMETRARNAGIQLIEAEKEVSILKSEVEELQDNKAELMKVVDEIQVIMQMKDSEFQQLTEQSSKALEKLQHLQKEMLMAESKYQEKGKLLQDIEVVLNEKHREFDRLKKQLGDQHGELEEVCQHLGQEKVELNRIEDMIKKRQSQLEMIQRDVQTQINQKRLLIQETEQEWRKKQEEKMLVEKDIKEKMVKLDKIQYEISQGENQLECVKQANMKQKSDLNSIRDTAEQDKRKLEMLDSKISDQQRELKSIQCEIVEKKESLEVVRLDLQQKSQELRRLKHEVGETEDIVVGLKLEERTLETKVSCLKNEINVTQNKLRTTEENFEKMNRAHNKLQSDHEETQSGLEQLEKIIAKVERELDSDATSRFANQEEGDGQQASASGSGKLNKLQSKIRNLGKELVKTHKDKEQVTEELCLVKEEISDLKNNMGKERSDMMQKINDFEKDIGSLQSQLDEKLEEMQRERDQHSQQVAELEGIAQAHYQKANRLVDQLNCLQSEYLDTQRRLVSEEEREENERKLEDTLRELKTDIRTEVSGSLAEIENRHLRNFETKSDEFKEQKDGIGQHLDHLKEKLDTIRTSALKATQRICQDDLEASRANIQCQIEKQQDFLKNQLRQKMYRHEANMQAQRQLSYDSLQNLKKNLSNLEQVLSASSGYASSYSDPVCIQMYPVNDSKSSLSPTTPSEKDLTLTTQDLVPTRGGDTPPQPLSPHRYSLQRAKPSPSVTDTNT